MKEKFKCFICTNDLKEYGKIFCSVECLYINVLFSKKSKIRRRLKELVKEDFEIIIKTKNKKFIISEKKQNERQKQMIELEVKKLERKMEITRSEINSLREKNE